jgi:hypothetical protein
VKTLVGAAAVAAAALGFSAPAQANLIVNGDFEAGVPSPWVITGNISYISTLGGDFWFGGGSTAQNGKYAVAFNAGDTIPNGYITQTFSLVAGETYELEYDFGSTRSASHQITVSVLGGDGLTVLASQIALEPNPPQALTTFSLLFTADANQATLRFLDNPSNPTFSRDGILDNVSVLAVNRVPEPASLGLVALALAGLGLRRFAVRK